jgi:hypothetical protein
MRLTRSSGRARAGAAAPLALVAALIVLGRGDARAQPVDHAARGSELFVAGKLDEAVREFELAYRDTPEPSLLFALGRVHAARKDCVRALDHYRRYLDTRPGPKATDAAQAELEKCKPPVTPEGDPVGDPVPRKPRPASPPADRKPAAAPSFMGSMIRDRFVQVGLVTGVVAAGTFVYALREACWDFACEGMSHSEFLERRDRAPKIGLAAGVLGGVAGALVVTGMIRYALHDDEDTRFEAGLAATGGGGTVVLSGRF